MKITILYDTDESTIAVKDKILSVLGNASLTFEKGSKAVSDWVSVEDRLPSGEQDVLAFSKLGEETRIIPCNFYNGKWFDCVLQGYVDTITHWMPLPTPPKENEQ